MFVELAIDKDRLDFVAEGAGFRGIRIVVPEEFYLVGFGASLEKTNGGVSAFRKLVNRETSQVIRRAYCG